MSCIAPTPSHLALEQHRAPSADGGGTVRSSTVSSVMHRWHGAWVLAAAAAACRVERGDRGLRSGSTFGMEGSRWCARKSSSKVALNGRVVAQRNRRLCLVREHRELVFAARERVVQHAVCERGRLATLIRIHTREDAHLAFVRGRKSARRLDEALEGVPRAAFASELIRDSSSSARPTILAPPPGSWTVSAAEIASSKGSSTR